MGCVQNISATEFPRQSDKLHQNVKVCFHYNTDVTFTGKVIRDDMEFPHITIFQLEDNRVVLATECMWSPLPIAEPIQEAPKELQHVPV